MRTKLGALLGAGGLLLLAASATVAAPPAYSISVSKTASPASVGVGGGTVAFTVWVTNDGAGFLQTVNVTDPLAGCTLGAAVETSGDGDTKLENGETWSYSCSVPNTMPNTENTATVNACHDVSACNNAGHDAQDEASVTVLDDGSSAPPSEAPSLPPSEAPSEAPSVAPSVDPGSPAPSDAAVDSPNPSQDTAGLTEAPTDTVGDAVGATGGNRSLMLVFAIGMLLASLILVTPTRPVGARNRGR
jgi:uncharacterized repeat protein (TIGR01451 family)